MRTSRTDVVRRWPLLAVALLAVLGTLPASSPAAASTPSVAHIDISHALSGHSCAVLSDGTVYCWGRNNLGQLGDGTTTDRAEPVKVSGITTATRVAAGGRHSCAVLSDGTVRCWGDNVDGQLGDGTQTGSLTPVTVAGLDAVLDVSLGERHTCALQTGGTVRCWGNALSGKLGDGNPDSVTFSTAHVAVSGITTATQISVGGEHACARLSDGTVRCWGEGFGGLMGNGTTDVAPTAVTVTGISTATGISADSGHTCAVLSGGTVECWGSNESGQLGDGTTTLRSTPVGVAGLTDAVQVASGRSHTCARLTGGTVRCWGNNFHGQLGDGTTTDSLAPVAVIGLSGVADLAAGYSHSCARLTDGTARCWGSAVGGRLGDGGTTDRLTPVPILFAGSTPPPPPPPPPPSTGAAVGPAVDCDAPVLAVGRTVSCTVTGGEPGIDILWRASFNPVVAEAGVTLDDSGSGTFAFAIPTAALGAELRVELVEWTAPLVLGVVGGPVPVGVSAGAQVTSTSLFVLLAVGATGGVALIGRRTLSPRRSTAARRA